MTDVREIISRMLDEPAPPPRPAAQVLATARRARRRRSASWVGSALATLVVLSLAGFVVGAQRSATEPIATAAVPPGGVAPAHGRTMAAVLVAALPPGFTAGVVETFNDSPLPGPGLAVDAPTSVLAAAVVPVFSDGGAGEVFAYLVHESAPAPGPRCDAVEVAASASCEIQFVGGDEVQVVVHGQGWTTGWEATRFVAGGRVVVGERRYRPAGANTDGRSLIVALPPLAVPPIDPVALAALAADPAMLPS